MWYDVMLCYAGWQINLLPYFLLKMKRIVWSGMSWQRDVLCYEVWWLLTHCPILKWRHWKDLGWWGDNMIKEGGGETQAKAVVIKAKPPSTHSTSSSIFLMFKQDVFFVEMFKKCRFPLIYNWKVLSKNWLYTEKSHIESLWGESCLGEGANGCRHSISSADQMGDFIRKWQ